MIDLVPDSTNPTLSLVSEEHVVHPSLPLNNEVKVVESISSPTDPTLSSKSFNDKVVTLTQSLSHIPIESEMKLAEVFFVSLDCYRQGEILSISKETPISVEVISFHWSSLTKYHLPSCVPF